MVECTFCGKDIQKGTGLLYVKKDGKKFDFCSSKCENNMINLGRNLRKIKWTKTSRELKEVAKAKP